VTEGVGRSAWHGIEVRHLAALQALAEEESFHGAARRLGYSQPAVSQQLAALERIVGTQLVNRPRVSQPLTLTKAGERLLVHARAIHASLTTAEAELGAASGKTQLRVGTFQTVAALLLPHVVRDLARTAPEIEMAFDDCSGDTPLVAALERGELDACFVDLPRHDQHALQTQPLALDEYVLVLPRRPGKAVERAPVRPAELRALKLIAFKSSGSTRHLINHLRGKGIDPQFVLRTDDNNVVQGFVAAGFGAALIPGLAAGLLSGSFDVLQLEPPLPPRVIALAWTRELAAAPAVRALVDATRRVAARVWRDYSLDRQQKAAAQV
jgi:DNA-binding transcriptional LysR family regulator